MTVDPKSLHRKGRGMKSNIIDIDVILVHETASAVLVKDAEDAEPVWLPRSQIEIATEGAAHVVTAPEWLLVEKGLL